MSCGDCWRGDGVLMLLGIFLMDYVFDIQCIFRIAYNFFQKKLG